MGNEVLMSHSRSLGTLTVDDVLEYIGFGKFHWRISFINGLAWVADAMEIIIMTILSPQLRCEWRLESYQVAVMSSVVFLAMGIGSPIWGIFCDKYGRRNGLAICACSILYFGLLSAFAPRYSWFVFLRFLVGFGIGAPLRRRFPSSQVYLSGHIGSITNIHTGYRLTVYSEFLPMNLRGRCLTLMGLFWAFGSMLEVLLALFIMPTLGWRWLLGLSAIPTGIFLIVNNWLPESPRFDMLSGRTAKALETLRYVAKQNRKPMPEAKIVTFKEDNRGQIKDLFTPEIRRTTLLLSFIWFSSIFCYYGIVMLTPSLLQSRDSCMADVEAMAGPACGLQCKYLTSDDYRHILWTSFADVPGPILLVFLVDRIGRKKSFAICFLMFSLFVLPMYACLGRYADIPVFWLKLHVGGDCDEKGPEMNTFAAHSKWRFIEISAELFYMYIVFGFQVMRSFSLYLTLSVYCGISLLAAIASLMLPIETRGKRLGETNQNQDAKVTTTTGDYAFFSDSTRRSDIRSGHPLMRAPGQGGDARSGAAKEQGCGVSPPTMALVTLQRSPTPSAASSASTTNSSAGEDFGSDDDRKNNQSLSESFFMVKGAALFLQQGSTTQEPKTPTHHKHAGDLPQHLQIMFKVLRSEDRIKLAVRLESGWSERVRYMVVVYTSGHQDTEENIVLGMDFTDKDCKVCSIGMVLPLWSDTNIHLDGDGGFSVNTAGRSHVFKPVSVQAMWSALQVLHKACEVSRRFNYFPGGIALTWMAFYESCVNSEQSCVNEWNAMTDLETTRPDSPTMFVDRPTERERTECLIKAKLRNIMTFQDLENITSKEIRNELEQHMSCNLKEYKEFIDNEMLLILGQMDKATHIFDHVYLGSEWNASNLEELRECGVGYILNVTREIDNFFPGMFSYLNVRVYDEEATDLLAHWNDTYNFIVKAKSTGWSLEKAYNFVRQKRGIAQPNAAFMRQLAEYEGILDASRLGLANLNTNNSNRLAAKRSCPAAFDDSATTGNPLKVKPSYQSCKDCLRLPQGRRCDRPAGGRSHRLNPTRHCTIPTICIDPPGTNFASTPVLQSLQATAAIPQNFIQACSPLYHCTTCTPLVPLLPLPDSQKAVSPMSCEEAPLDPQRGEMAAQGALASTVEGINLQPVGSAELQMQISGLGMEFGLELMQKRAKRSEKLQNLSVEG
ncbi:hypothetical protein fugu_018961 [Takifugu bimaculatus]|uniref:protein-serine/threonine phosphatase n=1 Tax=Takifugu bimaculatus TaxID=433685 RepID=A0A4Z2BIZ6_9TELE|nr:hypothetical protein fugu_018961 [Takifugu bimaculatus]